jgi:hypothetical protein
MGVDPARQWLADYEGEPFIQLDESERQLQRFLRDRAHQAQGHDPLSACITYGNLCHEIDPGERIWKHPRYKGIGQALGHVSLYEYRHGRPLLSALVIRAGEGHPGPGFVDDLCRRTLDITVAEGEERAFWKASVANVVRFWSDPDPMAAVDAMFDSIMREIVEIKRRLL